MTRRITNAQKSAQGQGCTLNIAGVCNYNPETVVLCHFGFGGDGTAKRRWLHESNAAYGCAACHDALDFRSKTFLALDETTQQDLQQNKWFYIARGIARTNEIRREAA